MDFTLPIFDGLDGGLLVGIREKGISGISKDGCSSSTSRWARREGDMRIYGPKDQEVLRVGITLLVYKS